MHDWFETPLGQFLLEQERQHCLKLLPSGYYPSSLQVAQPSVNFLADLETDSRFFVGERTLKTSATNRVYCARAHAFAMPFTHKTHNLIMLPHTLDFCEDPHAVLREVNDILVPKGCVVITGFNRLSVWGAIRSLMKVSRRQPWSARYRRVGQVQDWLSLLGFDLVGAHMLFYQPPLQSEKWRQRFDFMEKVGDRWLPGFGAVYILIGRKEELATRTRKHSKWRRLLPNIAQPQPQSLAQQQQTSQKLRATQN